MAYKIEHLTEDEQQALREKYPEAEVKPYQFMDGTLVIDYYDTEQEAKAEMAIWKEGDAIQESYEDWEDEITTKYPNVDLERVRELVMTRIS